MTYTSEEIIKVENLKKSFGKIEIIKGISFSVHRGEVLSIIGPSGSGKSTVLRCISQLESVEHGEIAICGKTLVKDGVYADKDELHRIALKSGLVFQNFNLFPHYSVLKNVTDAQIHVLKKLKKRLSALLLNFSSKWVFQAKRKAIRVNFQAVSSSA